MMRFISRLHKKQNHASVTWHESNVLDGVRFAIRSVSLQQRIELNERLRALTLKNEFLKAGDVENQLEAGLSNLLVARLYLEWGLEDVEGLLIDGRKATPPLLISHGPESLVEEIVGAIQNQIALTEDERKNS